ncbi:MAG: malto-oligosyltrehalose trehalohydrolase [Deltaproteobacteria bacterium]|nr:malto-oligosyltrehalose trehalohydrolase [Deltaproteobacteria bacterium]
MTGIPAGSYKYDDGLSIGAQVLPGGVFFRVWAPGASRVEAAVEGKGIYSLAPEGRGYFSGFAAGIRAGDLYRYRLDSGKSYSDPASRFQPEGPDGPSEVIDPGLFPWTDSSWTGVSMKGQVIYEMHTGTFTREGTWEVAARELRELKDLGVTLVELMPVADFPGRFGWGYDGVNLYAPTRLYGRPDGLRAFVDRAHSIGLGVILDVVYNHTGPEGCVLSSFSKDYFTDRYVNEWGKAVNFDGEGSAPVRDFFIENARYWIREFHMDGLRLDATQMIFDESRRHILAELTEAVKKAAAGRLTVVIAENEPQDTRLIAPPEEGGFGIDALWNDDFHHSAHVAMTGRAEAYYLDYRGKPQEFVSSIKWGYLYQGQRSIWQGKTRGTPSLRVEPLRFVNYLQNHDQVANSATGLRALQLASPGRLRALTTLFLLAPSTPLIFQGQEFASSSPFLYFCDLEDEIMKQVRSGRKEFLRQFKSIAGLEDDSVLPDPGDPATFEKCKLDTAERLLNRGIYGLHKDLLRLRREDPVISLQTGEVDGAVVASEAFVLRFFGDNEDRLLLVNLGPDLKLLPCPEPLLAPGRAVSWKMIFSSEHPRYGGGGTPPFNDAEWAIPGHSAILLAPVEKS